MDNSLMKSFGWEPRIGMEDGLRSTYQWYAGHA